MTEAELEAYGEARSEVRHWMLDPRNWNPVSGSYARVYSNEEIEGILEGATIHREDDAGGPVVVVSGWLSKVHGVDETGEGYPFLLVRETDEPVARHLLYLPTRPYHDGDEVDASIEPCLPAHVAGALATHGD
ncbi:hypothetical protein [Burkholderia pseudomallei]|uniref:hypothetical protein n=1 Tax=Burkholderia pseudomallei TaxID=28450 RepID=UPI0012F49462|nr:hypothetical protein [Burkholderia pseudomallei]